jgi:hypothetical protein
MLVLANRVMAMMMESAVKTTTAAVAFCSYWRNNHEARRIVMTKDQL